MIVRDNASILPTCLESIRPWVDETIVVDTGSLDDTPQIARRFGAKVFQFEWCDDFSAARNESLRHARGEWIFWMDSDDVIDADNGSRLQRLARAQHPQRTLAYVMQVHCPSDNGASGQGTIVDHVKLFRNHPQLRFEGRIHEQVLPSIRRLGGEVAWTDLFVVHAGSDRTAEGRARKHERDLRILGRELEEHPDHPFVLFNLGMTYADMGEHATAAVHLGKCLAVSTPDESHLRKAYALQVNSFNLLGRHSEALELCRQGLALFQEDAELQFRLGMLEHQAGRHEAAVAAYRGALAKRTDRYFSSMDRGIVGHKARHNLALTYLDMDRPDLAELQWRLAVEEVPDFRPAWQGLCDVLLQNNRLVSAAVASQTMRQHESLCCDSMVIDAQIAEKRGNVPAAVELLRAATKEYPSSDRALEPLCRLLFEHGDPDAARQVLEQLVELRPDDPSAHLNLGAIQARLGRLEESVESLRRSVELRPRFAATWAKLAEVLQALGREDEAQEAAQRAAKHASGSSNESNLNTGL